MSDIKTMPLICLRCKKDISLSMPTFKEISYTHYSYCEDCLREGLKALKSWERYSDELWKKAYARGYNDAKIQIAESGEYERAYQRGYEDGRKREWTAVAESGGEDDRD